MTERGGLLGQLSMRPVALVWNAGEAEEVQEEEARAEMFAKPFATSPSNCPAGP